MVCLSGGGYQPTVPPVPPLEDHLAGEEEAAKGAMKVVVSVMLMGWGGTAVKPWGVVR